MGFWVHRGSWLLWFPVIVLQQYNAVSWTWRLVNIPSRCFIWSLGTWRGWLTSTTVTTVEYCNTYWYCTVRLRPTLSENTALSWLLLKTYWYWYCTATAYIQYVCVQQWARIQSTAITTVEYLLPLYSYCIHSTSACQHWARIPAGTVWRLHAYITSACNIAR